MITISKIGNKSNRRKASRHSDTILNNIDRMYTFQTIHPAHFPNHQTAAVNDDFSKFYKELLENKKFPPYQ